MYNTERQAGFALLISLIVVGVVISVGLSILDLSIKQVRLSSNAKQSELAFHAANAGMECARYWRRENSALIENGGNINPDCFDVPAGTITPTSPSVTGDGKAFQYQYEFDWGSGTDVRCTSVNMLVASSTSGGSGVTIGNINGLIPGYPDVADTGEKICGAGSRCTTISVEGYNLSCANKLGYGVVQREVLLEF
jgi:type II secretory pathway pseudopilin PulG